MTFKDQLVKIKDNWFLVLIGLIVLFFVIGGSNIFGGISDSSYMGKSYAQENLGYADYERSVAPTSYRGGDDFAPEVEERKIVKTASTSVQVEEGQYYNAEFELKRIVEDTGSFILNQNVNKFGRDNDYTRGNFQLKVPTNNYYAVVQQLKQIAENYDGKTLSFNENARDITGQYVSNEVELELETEKLKTYQGLYDEADNVNDKLQLTDRIFNQQRRIKYLEQALNNKDLQIEYSTISVSITEKTPKYVNISLIGFWELIKLFVGSVSSLFALFFVIIPWAIAGFIIWIIYKAIKARTE
ncbi:DUF4349 domain-containing protein [Nanoarchaeota archaeon]